MANIIILKVIDTGEEPDYTAAKCEDQKVRLSLLVEWLN